MSDELRWWYYGCDQQPEQHLWTPERIIETDPQFVKLGLLAPLLFSLYSVPSLRDQQ
jgi:hypothetical protein